MFDVILIGQIPKFDENCDVNVMTVLDITYTTFTELHNKILINYLLYKIKILCVVLFQQIELCKREMYRMEKIIHVCNFPLKIVENIS